MEPQTITLDGVQYQLDSFSDEVKHLVGIYNIWQKEAQELRLKLVKDEFALAELNRKLVSKLQEEIQEQTKAEEVQPET